MGPSKPAAVLGQPYTLFDIVDGIVPGVVAAVTDRDDPGADWSDS